MVIYDSSLVYITSATTIEARLLACRNVIDALYVIAATGAGTANFESYELDDGQTKVFTKYRNAKDIYLAISAFERLEQRYLNQLNGRRMRLVNGKNFIERWDRNYN
jgi:hypothetical protein